VGYGDSDPHGLAEADFQVGAAHGFGIEVLKTTYRFPAAVLRSFSGDLP
jgi:hypothetical protein